VGIAFSPAEGVPMTRRTSPGHLLVAILILCITPFACATSVRQVSIENSLQAAEFVFHGVVVEREAFTAAAPDAIFTRLRFKVLDVIKGPALGEVELVFSGGTAGGFTVAVGEMQIPNLGEEGVYFVESLKRTQVNPLYGWQQGQFLVLQENGERRVHTAARAPVYGIDPVAAQPGLALSSGAARGVQTRASDASARPLSVEEFKTRLRAMRERR